MLLLYIIGPLVLIIKPRYPLPKNKLRQRPHYSWESWKRSFISMVTLTVHINLSRKRELFENALQTGGIWKPRLYVFVWTKEHFENGAFRKRWRHDNHVISLTEFSSNTNSKWLGIVAFLNSSGVALTENIWFVFRVKPAFLNSSGVGRGLCRWCARDFFFSSFQTLVCWSPNVQCSCH